MAYHDPSKCAGRNCPIHNPSDHHMKDWPKVLKMSSMIERTCTHGTGHPDPDSVAYFVSIGHSELSMHGCDGCCRPPEEKTS